MTHKQDPLDMVREFTLAFGIDWKSYPGSPTGQTALLRVQLVTEELAELAHALAAGDKVEAVDALTDIDYVTYGAMGAFGCYFAPVGFVDPSAEWDGVQWGQADVASQLMLLHHISAAVSTSTFMYSNAMREGEMEKMTAMQINFWLKGILHATANAWAALGLLKYREAAFAEVQRANMSKLGPDGKPILNEAGRVVKGPHYRAPDIAAVIKAVDFEELPHVVA